MFNVGPYLLILDPPCFCWFSGVGRSSGWTLGCSRRKQEVGQKVGRSFGLKTCQRKGSQASFTLDPDVLIEELKLQIDEQNIEA